MTFSYYFVLIGPDGVRVRSSHFFSLDKCIQSMNTYIKEGLCIDWEIYS